MDDGKISTISTGPSRLGTRPHDERLPQCSLLPHPPHSDHVTIESRAAPTIQPMNKREKEGRWHQTRLQVRLEFSISALSLVSTPSPPSPPSPPYPFLGEQMAASHPASLHCRLVANRTLPSPRGRWKRPARSHFSEGVVHANPGIMWPAKEEGRA